MQPSALFQLNLFFERMLVSATAVSATAISATTVSAAAPAISATAKLLLWPCFVNGNDLSVERATVKLLNGCRGTFFCFHFDKAEPFGLAGKFILDHGRGDSTSPASEKFVFRSSFVTLKDRLPTYRFLFIFIPFLLCPCLDTG